MPSKTLRETALAISGLRSRDLYGVDLSLRREATVADFLFARARSRTACNANVRPAARDLPGRCSIYGDASFVDPHTMRVQTIPREPRPRRSQAPACVDGWRAVLRGEKILIATGSSPVRPPIFPFEHDRVHDSDTMLQLEQLPRSMAVVGAGVIGSEYACTFAALGTKVQVIDGRDVLLPFLDSEVSAGPEPPMMERIGDRVPLEGTGQGAPVASRRAAASGDIALTLTSGGTMLTVDAVLVAAGRYEQHRDPEPAGRRAGARSASVGSSTSTSTSARPSRTSTPPAT